MTTRAAIYLRVSTPDQADADRFGLDVQSGAIRRYAEAHQIELADTYTDTITGTRHRRDNLDLLLDRASAYDAVIISSVDRLGRRNRVTYAVLDELLDSGLQVHSTDMGHIDPDDEGSMLAFGVHSLFAENDHRRLTKKLQRAMIAKVAGNPLTGRPGQPVRRLNGYGWRGGEIDPVEHANVQWMFERLQFVGTTALARECAERGIRTRTGKPWIPADIRRIVRNPMYKGVYEWGRTAWGKGEVKARCEVPALVSPELWDSVNRRMSERRANARNTSEERRELFPLTGHMKCAECGRAMSPLSLAAAPRGAYACARTTEARHVSSGRITCTHRTQYQARAIHVAVLDALRGLACDDAALVAAAQLPAPPAPDLSAARADLGRRADRLEAAYMAGAYTAEEYAQRRADLRAQLAALDTTPIPLAPPRADVGMLRELLRQSLEQPLYELADRVGLKVLVHPGGALKITLDPPEL